MSEVDVSKSKEFELPNGIKVELSILKEKNFDNLTLWIRQQYMRNIRSVLGELTKEEQEMVLNKAVRDAAMMSSRTEEGLRVLYQTVHGYSRMCYEMIQSPSISFEEFDKLIFPENDSYLKGLAVLNDMFSLVYNEMFTENAVKLFGENILKEVEEPVSE